MLIYGWVVSRIGKFTYNNKGLQYQIHLAAAGVTAIIDSPGSSDFATDFDS